MGFSVRNAVRSTLVKLINKALPILEKSLQKLGPQDFNHATERDIYYCYRLFLHRQPDPEGYNLLLNQISRGHFPLADFTDSFLYSYEFREIQKRRNEPICVNLPEFQIYVRINDTAIGGAIARSKIYEPNVTQIVKELLQPGLTFLDVGANIGYYSMLAAAHVKDTGRVIAFEPIAENRELFIQSVQANNFQNVELFPYAVSNSEQTVSLVMGGRGSNSRIISSDQANQNHLQAQTIVLDVFLPDLKALDIVKIDIEGAEYLAMNGMSTLIERFRPHIITEFSPSLIPKTSLVQPIDYLNQLVDFGYDLQVIYHNGKKSENMNPQQVLEYFEESGHSDHIDLLATPTLRTS